MINTISKINFSIQKEYIKNYSLNDICFFDIETTGFSALNTSLYLIGFAYFESGQWFLKQWFAEKNDDEKSIIIEFMNSIQSYNLIISYNGLGFDSSYLKKKCEIHNIDFTLDKINHLDIYKQIQPYRKFFKLEHLKQKNIEEFLLINREDKYSGKELISQYVDYLKTYDDIFKSNLLVHNRDDITGMFSILPILSYSYFFKGQFSIESITIENFSSYNDESLQEAIIEFKCKTALPKRISFGMGSFYFTAFKNTAKLKIRIYNNELKFFYSNYQDYYYLPKEDIAMHKSVAFYVDKNFRTRAKAANCYSKKTGRFLPQFEEVITPYFKIEYHDKITYFEMTDDFMTDDEQLKKYSAHILNYLIKHSK